MLFSSRLPLSAVVAWTRALKHGLHVGLSPVRVFRQQAKSGPAAGRDLARTLADRLQDGESLADALEPDRDRLPLLFVELAAVGEETGRLSETFAELERYFETVQEARRNFVRALIWPGFMYFGAIFVIAGMLLVLGLIAPADGKGFDPLGLGLLGWAGAMTFLLLAGMFTAAWVGAFLFVQGNDRLRSKAEGFSLRVPGLAGCFRAFALQRFAMAFHMAAEAGLRADRVLTLSLRATANAAYLAHAERAAVEARRGNEVTDILEGCGPQLFPAEFRDAVEVGETAGQLAEVMEKQAGYYREEAGRKLKLLTMIAGGAVYALIGLMVIVVIVRILMSIAGIYQDAMKGL